MAVASKLPLYRQSPIIYYAPSCDGCHQNAPVKKNESQSSKRDACVVVLCIFTVHVLLKITSMQLQNICVRYSI